MKDVFGFVVANWDTIATLLAALVALIKATAWGSANARALRVVAAAVEASAAKEPAPERNDAQAVKAAVATEERSLPPAVRDALRDAVSSVDPGKSATTPLQRLVRELTRVPGK